MSRIGRGFVCLFLANFLLAVFVAAPAAEARPKRAESIFEQRILPIFNSPHPSSCIDCHLAGVDLKEYILPSHEKTFLSLRDQGLIDLERPAESKILRFIAMGGEDTATGADPPGKAPVSARVPAKVRQLEYEAFAAWIEASARDPRLRRAPPLAAEDLARPARPHEVIRHARNDRVLASFVANVWSQRFRCANCHAATGGRNAKLVEEHGDDVTWLRPGGPEATMQYLVASGAVDLDQPARSRMLRKATGEIKHGGGIKMKVGDQGYQSILGWIDDYARTVNDRYAERSDLPPGPTWFGTEIWLRVKDAPAEWLGRPVRMTVHRWNSDESRFEDEPVARTSTIAEVDKKSATNRTVAHNTLSILVPEAELVGVANSGNSPRLEPGRYRINVHVGEVAAAQADLDLGGQHPLGQTAIVAAWEPGYPKATEFKAGLLLVHHHRHAD